MFPVVADTSHAAPEVARFLDSCFTAKSAHDLDAWMGHFAEGTHYFDATLGWGWTSVAALHETLTQFVPNWGDGRSYPLRIVGGAESAIVVLVDTPELFGSGIIAVAPVDIRDGKIVRWVDYWDGRHFGTAAAAAMRTPAEQFPTGFGEADTDSRASERITDVVDRLAGALADGKVDAVTPLLTYDCVLDDVTLRARIPGADAIGRYLDRVLTDLPYGPGSSVRHVVGSDAGGGYEWRTPAAPGRGATVVELDGDGLITRLTAVWDGAMLDDDSIRSLAARAIDL